jgi:hypothetical protein
MLAWGLWIGAEPWCLVQVRGLEATPIHLTASFSDPPSVSLHQVSQQEPGTPLWLYVEVTFCWGDGVQPSLQVTDYTFDLLHYPYQALGTRQKAQSSEGTSPQLNPVV